jgi:hypothetical protein
VFETALSVLPVKLVICHRYFVPATRLPLGIVKLVPERFVLL